MTGSCFVPKCISSFLLCHWPLTILTFWQLLVWGYNFYCTYKREISILGTELNKLKKKGADQSQRTLSTQPQTQMYLNLFIRRQQAWSLLRQLWRRRHHPSCLSGVLITRQSPKNPQSSWRDRFCNWSKRQYGARVLMDEQADFRRNVRVMQHLRKTA